MSLYMLPYVVSLQYYLQLHATPKEKSRASFEVFAAEQPVIPFVCDMASCHRDIMSNDKFCWTFTPFKMRAIWLGLKSRDPTTQRNSIISQKNRIFSSKLLHCKTE
jgi:hypothetical protein